MDAKRLQLVADTAHQQVAKKPSKKEAFELVCRVIEGSATELETAKVYRFFMPNPVKNLAGKEWEWVSKVVGKQDVRYYLNYLCVENNQIKATNGHAFHLASSREALNLEAGLYDSDGVKKLPAGIFPCIRAIVSRNVPGEVVKLQVKTLSVTPRPVLEKKGIGPAYILDDKIGVSKKYLDNALAYSDLGVCEWFPEANKVLVTYPCGALAVVMCMRLK